MPMQVHLDEDQAVVQDIIGQIESACDDWVKYGRQDVLRAECRAAHDALAALLNLSLAPAQLKLVEEHPRIPALRVRLCELNAQFHQHSELAQAQAYIASAERHPDPFANSWLSLGFYELLLGQVARWRRLGLLADQDPRPIVVVGGGALPQTQVVLHRQTGRTVVSVEVDAETAQVARDFLKVLGFGDQLPVIHAHGCDYDYQETAMVVVATLVAEKNLVARRVAQTAPSAGLNVRNPVGLHRLSRTPVDLEELHRLGWHVVDQWTPEASSVSALTFARNLPPTYPVQIELS